MRSRQQFIATYAQSHRNTVNQMIHLVCVPMIFFSTFGLGWLVPVGRWLPGLAADAVGWINLSTLSLMPILIFYARLGAASLIMGALWAAASIAGIVAIQAAGLPLAWICGVSWIAAWIAQFYGHHLEGAKPSFAEDLLFLLIGPLFVSDKIGRLLTTGSMHRAAP